MANHIRGHRDFQPVPLEQFVAQVRRKRNRPGPLPTQTDETTVAVAYINHGNWVANCPLHDPETGDQCKGAELVDPSDLRFWCIGCDMRGNGGKWLRVAMPAPAKRAQIEGLMLARPRDRNRNWNPSETVAALRRENQEQGVL